jgi:Fic family protein
MQETPFYLAELVERYLERQEDGSHHRVLVVGLFVLDFLTIHPFVDGNGRLARLLSTFLLAESGYGIGRYVSLEGLVYERRDDYYESLASSTAGWHEGVHDPWPWLAFFVDVLTAGYETFARRTAEHRSGLTKQDRVRIYVRDHVGASFDMADVRRALPGVSDQTIRLVLRELRDTGVCVSSGTGRGARWVRTGR